MKKKIFIGFAILLLVITAVIGSLLFVGYSEYREVTSARPLKEYVSEIRDNATYIKIDDISQDYLDAVVAIEDKRFYEHNGVDYKSLIRVIYTAGILQDYTGGGSTITQQLAKNMYFSYEPNFKRKLAELFVASSLESNYSKKEILELYVNIINMGDNNMGIKLASNNYFNKQPKNLDLYESCIIASIPQLPAYFQLSNNNYKTYYRAIDVLIIMKETNKITDKEYDVTLEKLESKIEEIKKSTE